MTIDRFTGKYSFLSNFFPTTIEYDGVKYRTLEHAYQAAKHPATSNVREKIHQARGPAGAKLISRNYRKRDSSFNKMGVMEQLLRQKFNKPGMREALVETHPHEIIEGNNWGDIYWGVCDGVGQNRLGQLLMSIRAELLE